MHAWAQGLPKGRETEQFAQDLLARIPSTNGASRMSQNQVRERQAAALAQRNTSYAMLSDDEDDFAPAAAPAPTTAPLAKASKKSLRKTKVSCLCISLSQRQGRTAADQEVHPRSYARVCVDFSMPASLLRSAGLW